MTKTERWLNLLAFLLDSADWLKGDDKTRESMRRKFERDKNELKVLSVVI